MLINKKNVFPLAPVDVTRNGTPLIGLTLDGMVHTIINQITVHDYYVRNSFVIPVESHRVDKKKYAPVVGIPMLITKENDLGPQLK